MVSEVVKTDSVRDPTLEGLVTPLKVIRTWSPGSMASPLNKKHSTDWPWGAKQEPTDWLVVMSNTDPVTPANPVPAGNVTVIRLLAPADNPPVADAVNPTTYWVLADAAADGDPIAAVTPVSGLLATTL